MKVHGAGAVSEVENRFGETKGQGTCTVSPAGRSETSFLNCPLGTTDGLWNSGNVVRLAPSVPTAAYDRGWRFLKWADGTASGQVNRDPQDTTGDQTSPTYCEFQIFENLYVDLYFDDVHGPNATSISGGPDGSTNATSASFGFDATDDPDASFQCKLDRPGMVGGWFSCGWPYDKTESFTGLTANGTYTFSVRGADPSGNVDASPASRSWTVDTVPPGATIDGGPQGPTNDASPSLPFSTSGASSVE